MPHYSYVANWLLFATLCFFHLREIGPSRLKVKAATLAVFAAVAIATQSRLRSGNAFALLRLQSYVRHLKPPALRLAPPQSERLLC